MIIRISLYQKKILLNEILENKKTINEINNNTVFITEEKVKISLSEKLVNEIRDICVEKLLKFNNKLSEEYYIIKNLIDTLNENLTIYYKLDAKKNTNEIVLSQCLNSLGNNITIIKSYKQVDYISNLLRNIFPFTKWGRIDWEKIKSKIVINDIYDVLNIIKEFTEKSNILIYIIWSEGTFPIIKTELNNALRVLDDITMGFDFWFFSREYNFVIEFHQDQIMIGFSNKQNVYPKEI